MMRQNRKTHLTRICYFSSLGQGRSRIDLQGGMGIYTNTSTKKALKDIVLHYSPFTHTF